MMRWIDDEDKLPRIHLLGMVAIVLLLSLLLGGLFSVQNWREHGKSLAQMEHTARIQIHQRLEAELANAMAVIDFTRQRTESMLGASLVAQVDTAHDIARAIHERESARRSEAEVKHLIVEALRSVRFFEGRGYYFIDEMGGRFVLMPIAPRLEGTRTLSNVDDQGTPIMASLIAAARQPEGRGFARYRWYAPGSTGRMMDKLSYVRRFEPYDWLIGTGDYVYPWENRQRQEALDRLRATRFGQTGYVGVIDREGRSVLAPSTPELEGRHYSEMPPQGRAAVERLLSSARAGGGFVSYDWSDPVSGAAKRKTALVRNYEPWGWVLVATMFDDELQAALQQEIERHAQRGREQGWELLAAVAMALALAVCASLLFTRWTSRLLRIHRERQQQQQQALRESEYRLNTILDSVETCIFIKDRDYRYGYANRATCDLFGCAPQQVAGQDDSAFFDPGSLDTIRRNDERVFETGERVATEERLQIGGRDRIYAVVKLPLRDERGQVYAMCGVVSDITELKRIETDLAAARDAALAADRAKASFLANVSHELRTPMNAIIGSAYLLQETALSSRQHELLAAVQVAGQQLLGLIDDILNFVRLENGTVTGKGADFELEGLLDAALDRVRHQAEAKHLRLVRRLEPGLPPHLVGDAVQIGQVLRKLLDNAIKFTEAGSVGLSVALLAHEGGTAVLRFEVSDTGIGLGADEQAGLFRDFHQVDASSTRRYGGTGLGLAIARRLVEHLGGEIGVVSEPAVGSRFWFTVPVRVVAVEAGVGTAPPPSTLACRAAADPADQSAWPEVRARLARLLADSDVDSLAWCAEHADLLCRCLGERGEAVLQAVRAFDFELALALLQAGD